MGPDAGTFKRLLLNGTKMAKLLVVEDDPKLSEQLHQLLVELKHEVETVDNGSEAADRLKFYQYDLVILDWNLPGKNGVDVCREYRDSGGSTPIIMLTGMDHIKNKEAGLDSGADDYLTKPFEPLELGARVRALLRRPTQMVGLKLKAGNLEIDTNHHTVTSSGAELQLLPKEFALLEFFMKHVDQVFSQEALLERVWNSESESTISTVYSYIKTLRKKLGPDGQMIKTVHGVGYRFSEDE